MLIASAVVVVVFAAAIIATTSGSNINSSTVRHLILITESRKCGLRFPSAMRYYDLGYTVILVLGKNGFEVQNAWHVIGA